MMDWQDALTLSLHGDIYLICDTGFSRKCDQICGGYLCQCSNFPCEVDLRSETVRLSKKSVVKIRTLTKVKSISLHYVKPS